MSITLIENNKSLELDVLGYEFPDAEDDYFDANWLNVGIRYDDGQLSFRQVDSCLLAFELAELTETVDAILEGRESGTITDLTEPYLALAVTRTEETYAVQARFVYDTGSPWKEICVCQKMDRRGLAELNDGLKAMYARFPRRDGKG
jgi:hypothetical protein